ncbi:MAG: hypothetical protein JW855_02230 [Gammaproteobacteria bacterium]|nr:hypothetical protein [Gammaproteobacteria bacterium]
MARKTIIFYYNITGKNSKKIGYVENTPHQNSYAVAHQTIAYINAGKILTAAINLSDRTGIIIHFDIV